MLLAFVACEGITSSEPSALDFQERKAELEEFAAELRPTIEAGKRYADCQSIIRDARRRAEVISSAYGVAAVKGESAVSESYELLEEELKLLEQLERDLQKCANWGKNNR